MLNESVISVWKIIDTNESNNTWSFLTPHSSLKMILDVAQTLYSYMFIFNVKFSEEKSESLDMKLKISGTGCYGL